MGQNKHVDLNSLACVGCGNCTIICPHNALVMKPDQEGFLRPFIYNDVCVECGACVRFCQMYKSVQSLDKEKQRGYIAISKNVELYKNSASGGIFSTIAFEFLEKYDNSLIVGAAYQDGEVRHICGSTLSDVMKMQNSKYVQSNLGKTFIRIKHVLEAGDYVLFSGTPCQVFALQDYLQRPYERLFCIDLICHGVPSPLFLKKEFETYISCDKIERITFRKKSKLYKKKSSYILSLASKHKHEIIASTRSPYYNMFMNGLTFRPSCYSCKFTNLDRVGDITIGDCDSSKFYGSFHPKEATSCVIVNSINGKLLWEQCSKNIDYTDLDINKEAEYNHQLSKPVDKPESRDTIYQEIFSSDVNELRNKYARHRDLREKLGIIRFLYLP